MSSKETGTECNNIGSVDLFGYFVIPHRGKTVRGPSPLQLLHSQHLKLLSAPHLTPHLAMIPNTVEQRTAGDPRPEVELDEVESILCCQEYLGRS